MNHGHVDSGGLRLHYVAWGEGPLVLVHHGFLDHCRSWDRVARTLASSWRVVVLDARGHGDSGWIGAGGTYYFPDYVLDLRTLLEHLGDGPVHLVGHSMGAGVVSYYAGAFPEQVRSVTMVDGIGPPDESRSSAPTLLRQFVTTVQRELARRTPGVMPTLDDAAARMRRVDPGIDESLALDLARLATRDVAGGVSWKYDPLHRARAGVPFNLDSAAALWGAIRCPVLHVRGGRSPFILPDHEARKALFRDLREVVVPEAGHNVHVHAPDALAGHVGEFLAAT